jgi:hypothetical protein
VLVLESDGEGSGNLRRDRDSRHLVSQASSAGRELVVFKAQAAMQRQCAGSCQTGALSGFLRQ